MWLIHEVTSAFREPVIAACLSTITIHALLHDHPLRVIGDDEAVQVQIETILHSCAVHLRHQSACLGQFAAIEADAFANRDQLMRRLARMLPSPSAYVNPQFLLDRL